MLQPKHFLIGFGILIALFLLLKISLRPKVVPFIPPAGTITRTLGDQNFIKTQDSQIPAFVNFSIEPGQTILVGAKGLVELSLDDYDPQGRKTQVIIYENSSFIITETFLGQKNKFSAKLLSGWIKVLIQNLSAQDQHEIQTENTVVGVRGTTYYIHYLSDRTTTELHVLETTSGKKVTIAPRGKKETEVPAQTTATVIQNQDPILKPLDPALLPKEPAKEPEEEPAAQEPIAESPQPEQQTSQGEFPEDTPAMQTCRKLDQALYDLSSLYGQENTKLFYQESTYWKAMEQTQTPEEFQIKDKEYKILQQKEAYLLKQKYAFSIRSHQPPHWIQWLPTYEGEHADEKKKEYIQRCKEQHKARVQYHELNLAEVPDYCDLSQEACPEKLKELQPFFQNLYLSFQEKPIDPKPSITHGTPPKEFQDVCSELSGKLKKDFEKLEEQYRALDKEVWTYIVKPYDPVMRQKLKSGQETLRQLGKQKTCVYEAHARTAGTIESDSLWRVDLKLFEKNEKQVQECLGAYKRLYPTCYSTCAFTPKDCAEKLKDYPLYLLRLKSLSPLPDKKDKN